ncbi:MAG: cupin domain-containing protein [Magnetococcales bacterium]|uniref:Cupin domain-containing protein n=1 Tax=Candidatus Magnetobacterium casense TaxID=1455061 RepID=A0ABS6RX56_9BACT|nr:cupin domain-containing protein [Candidatus Magnetobacterium casensis]MBF0606988.1 cupin domain-containing protein [Nitrospirota bacterium]MBV6340383.1 cupin domain-containing protein [Candidatus Magnetobacterium casensis]
MANITIKKPTDTELNEMGVSKWPIWEKEVSKFDWSYDSTEMCYLLAGRVVVKTDSGEVEFGKGDFVTFPEGLSCTWDVKEPVRKHYKFK